MGWTTPYMNNDDWRAAGVLSRDSWWERTVVTAPRAIGEFRLRVRVAVISIVALAAAVLLHASGTTGKK